MTLKHRRSVALAIGIVGAISGGCAVKPTELSTAQLSTLAETSIANVAVGQEPIVRAVSLDEAIARALKYNLDHRVEQAEYAVRERELNLSHYSLLPTVVANSGYSARDSFSASSSRNVFTGVESSCDLDQSGQAPAVTRCDVRLEYPGFRSLLRSGSASGRQGAHPERVAAQGRPAHRRGNARSLLAYGQCAAPARPDRAGRTARAQRRARLRAGYRAIR